MTFAGWLTRLLAALICGGTAAILFASQNPWEDRGLDHIERHLVIIQDDLSVLAGQLRQYHAKHGRYPTNDEGLGALDTFEVRFPIAVERVFGSPHGGPWGSRGELFDFRARPHLLAAFRRATRRPPANQRELRDALGSPYGLPPEAGAATVTLDAAITADDHLLLIDGPSVLSPFELPYVYENRRGLDASAFADSPANADRRRRYSVEVDDGVFVYCLGGLVLSDRYDALWWERVTPPLAAVPFGLVALVLLLSLVRHGAWKSAGAVAAATAVVTLAPGHFTTCYIMASPFSYRDPQIVLKQKALLDKHREAGVISEETYQRVLESIRPALDEAQNSA